MKTYPGLEAGGQNACRGGIAGEGDAGMSASDWYLRTRPGEEHPRRMAAGAVPGLGQKWRRQVVGEGP